MEAAGIESESVENTELTSFGQCGIDDGQNESNYGQNNDLEILHEKLISLLKDILGQSNTINGQLLSAIFRQQKSQLLDLIQVVKTISTFPYNYKIMIIDLLTDNIESSCGVDFEFIEEDIDFSL